MGKPFSMKKSVAGASHGYKNCQDSCRIETMNNDITLAAVADGHGSAKCKYSDRGAEFAVKAFILVVKKLWENVNNNQEDFIRLLRQRESADLIQVIHNEWKNRIQQSGKALKIVEEGNDSEIDPELFGTTLLGMVIAPTFVFALQIGDGDIMFVNNEGVKCVLDSPKFLGTETYSLSDSRPWEHAVTYFQRIDINSISPYMFMMTTDGFANSFMDNDQYLIACRSYFDTIKEYGPNTVKRQLFKWLTQTSTDGCGDDITFLAVGEVD